MDIHKITIRNILGVEALEFAPARGVTRITGANGVGKTSVLEALRSIVRGGHDATLLRAGQKEGEVVIEFEGGVIEERIRERGTTRNVKVGGVPQPKPAEAIGRLWDSVSANPVEFVTAKPARRIDMLLEVIDPAPVVAAVEELLQSPAPGGSSALEIIAAARKAAYDERTVANRDAKTARDHAEALSADMPEVEGDVAERAAAAKARAEGLRSKLVETAEAIKRDAEEARTKSRDQYEAEVAAAQAEHDKRVEAIRSACESALEEVRAKAEDEITAAVAEAERLAEAQRVAREAEGRRKVLAELKENGAKRAARAAQLSALIEKLDELKEKTLAELNIPGVSVEDGEITYGGVPFCRLNTATQWQLAIKLARLRAGELPIVCCDGLEALDDENWAAFRESAAAAEPPVYFIVTDRGEGPLAVDTEAKR